MCAKVIFGAGVDVSDEMLEHFVKWLNGQLLATPFHDWVILTANTKSVYSSKDKGKRLKKNVS